MATLTVQEATLAGIVPTYGAAAGGGDNFPNDGMTYFHVKNGGGSSITVTIDSLVACNQGQDHDAGGSVANASEKIFGPFPAARFNDVNGRVAVTYSGVTTVTVAAIRIKR